MHPMYRKPDGANPNLWQGDLINREELIRQGALKGHQDYIANRHDFCGFCVLTQTCDLVREERRRCAEFICLAVIRKVVNVFSREDVEGKGKNATENLLRSAINHNENKRGYFYLYPEPAAGIVEDSVVDLRVMFSLFSDYHYQQIRASRLMSLTDVYANKLGWMAGHLFSRVPTPDWNELRSRKEELKAAKTADEYVDQLVGDIKTRGKKLGVDEKPFLQTG